MLRGMAKPLRYIDCSGCTRKAVLHKAKGLCNACYQRQKSKKPRVREVRTCGKCDEDRPYKGQGLCTRCHAAVTKQRRLAKPAQPCVKCGEDRVILALGKCGACYEHDRYETKYKPRLEKPTECPECGRSDRNYVKGVCIRCYDARRSRGNGLYINCAACSELKPHVAHGLCRKCYSAAWQAKNKDRTRPRITCAECGNLRGHAGQGLCRRCYSAIMQPLRNLQRNRKYRTDIDHRERAKLQATKRRMRRLGVPGSHTVAEWRTKLAEHHNKCAYCKADLGSCPTKDHVIPITREGATDYIENIVPACVSCNSRKGSRTGREFRAWLARQD